MVGTTPARSSWTRWLLQRWPTALAIPPVALILTGPEAGTDVAELLPLLPLEYLIVAKLQRRQATWPVISVALVATLALQELDVVPPSTVFAAVALLVLVWGAVDGQLLRPGAFRVQALGMLGFGALALVGLVVEPDLGRYVVAAAWFLHGLWDFVYFRLDQVVARSYAEWCGVVDVLVAAGLVFLL
jgi:hypothetical protein